MTTIEQAEAKLDEADEAAMLAAARLKDALDELDRQRETLRRAIAAEESARVSVADQRQRMRAWPDPAEAARASVGLAERVIVEAGRSGALTRGRT